MECIRVNMSSGERYLVPEVPDASLDPIAEEQDTKTEMRAELSMYHRRWREIKETQSYQKPGFGSAVNYPSEPFSRRMEPRKVDSPMKQFASKSMDYPDAPIFPTEPGLNSRLADYGRQEGRQLRMDATLKMLPHYWAGRFEEGPPKGIF